jgi:hypothetical protein
MNREFYPFKQNPHTYHYTFYSEGVKGKILKSVIFQEIENDFCNLALGDYDEANEYFDDQSITDNGDLVKVLSTVFHITAHFLMIYPEKKIYVEANTHIKQRLYNRIIKNNFSQIQADYQVFGVLENEELEIFEPNTDYKALIVKKK